MSRKLSDRHLEMGWSDLGSVAWTPTSWGSVWGLQEILAQPFTNPPPAVPPPTPEAWGVLLGFSGAYEESRHPPILGVPGGGGCSSGGW